MSEFQEALLEKCDEFLAIFEELKEAFYEDSEDGEECDSEDVQ